MRVFAKARRSTGFKNQLHFERNLMPHMLGWFALRPDTSIEDAEWLLARAAGFDAGFALAASLASTAQLQADPGSADAAKEFGATPAILAAIREWETARMLGAFPAETKARLRDNGLEFHLNSAGEGKWDLFEAHSERFTLDSDQAASMDFKFSNPNAPQTLQWAVKSGSKEPLIGLVVEINEKVVADSKERGIPPGGSMKYSGGPEAVIYDAAWKEKVRVPVEVTATMVGLGKQAMRIRAAAGKKLKIELRTLSAPMRIGKRASD